MCGHNFHDKSFCDLDLKPDGLNFKMRLNFHPSDNYAISHDQSFQLCCENNFPFKSPCELDM